jgi:glutamyl-tRNA reductase
MPLQAEKLPLLLLGLNHRSAPLPMREQWNVPVGEVERSLQRIKGHPAVQSCLLLNTCNRVEYYLAGSDPQGMLQGLRDHLEKDRGLPLDHHRPHLYQREGVEAVRHLFRVAASVDSLVIGEPQILGQVKEAYFRSVRAGTSDRLLDRILHRTFTVAKKVRSETEIGRHPLSISHVAVDLARQIFSDFREHRCLVIGSGEMAELAVRYLMGEGIKDLFVANRSLENAAALARDWGGTALPLAKAAEYLEWADLVIASAGADHYLLRKEEVAAAMRRRKWRPLFLIDIGVPRNLDPALRELENVFLYDLDDLQAEVESHRQEREAALAAADEIIEREMAGFLRTFEQQSAREVIRLLGEKAELIRRNELARTLGSLPQVGAKESAAMEAMTRSIVKRLIHDPIQFIRNECFEEEGGGLRELVERIFKLGGFLGADGNEKGEADATASPESEDGEGDPGRQSRQ